MREERFDLVVIGAGPAGLAGAIAGAILGRSVALVEREPELGGALINTGTLPSKTLRETALALSGFPEAPPRRRDMHLVGVHVLGEQATELVHMGLMTWG